MRPYLACLRHEASVWAHFEPNSYTMPDNVTNIWQEVTMTVGLLRDFVIRAGTALEAEDRLIIGAGRVRGETGGILRLDNERYYQFIVWRSILPRWGAAVEQNAHDLVIFDDHNRNKYYAIFEIKRWMSGSGRKEILGMKKDIKKLQQCDASNAFLVIFSANERNDRITQIDWLENKLFQEMRPEREEYCFNTINEDAKEVEFWVGAWQIKPGVSGGAVLRFDLNSLVAGIFDDNRHDELSTGPARGNEFS